MPRKLGLFPSGAAHGVGVSNDPDSDDFAPAPDSQLSSVAPNADPFIVGANWVSLSPSAIAITTASSPNVALSASSNSAIIVINSVADLENINNNLSGNFILGANIDASSVSGFVPIGTLTNPFTGTFDGQGHVIKNLIINLPSASFVGLFGISTGVIQNVGLIGGSVAGHDYVGGLIGENLFGTVTNVYATGTVSGSDHVGGLIGDNYGGTVTNVYATGTVSGSDYDVGGLIGRWNYGAGAVTNVYATGAVSGSYVVGGLIGEMYGNNTVNAYATGTVSGIEYVGGLVGAQIFGAIDQSYAVGPVVNITPGSGYTDFGGLIGYRLGGVGGVTNSYWDTYTTGQAAAVGYGSSSGVTGVSGDPALSGSANYAFKQSAYSNFNFTNIWGINPNINNGYPYLLWQVVDQPPVIDAANSVVAGTVNELVNATGSSALDYANGASVIKPSGVIAFSDPDTTDRPTASVDTAHETVIYKNVSGTIFSLTSAEIAGLEAGFSITPEAGNTNTGKIDWTYAVTESTLDFLGVGETVTITTPIIVDDHNGGTLTQDVVVTINGADDNPVATRDTAFVQEGNGVAASRVAGILINDTDPDIHDLLHVTAVSFGRHTVSVSTNSSAVIQGRYGELFLNADGSYSYVANENIFAPHHGGTVQDVFTYTVTDGHTTANGQLVTAQSTLTVTVVPRLAANETPILVGYPIWTGDNSLTPFDQIIQGNRADASIFVMVHGQRVHENDHLLNTPEQWAYDFSVSGQNIHAVGDGVVMYVKDDLTGNFQGYGNVITIQSTDAAGNPYYVTYAHLQAYTTTLQIGDTVKEGKVIAVSGDSGTWDGTTTHPHLHIQFGTEAIHQNLDTTDHTVQGIVADGTPDGTAPVYFPTLLMHYDQAPNLLDKIYNGTAGTDIFYANDRGDTIYGAGGGDNIILHGGILEALVYKLGTDSLISDVNKDGHITIAENTRGINDTGGFPTMDIIANFTDNKSIIDLSALNFAPQFRHIRDLGSAPTGDMTNVSNFFTNGAHHFGAEIAYDGANTFVFVDSNHDGNFTAGADYVIELVGVHLTGASPGIANGHHDIKFI